VEVLFGLKQGWVHVQDQAALVRHRHPLRVKRRTTAGALILFVILIAWVALGANTVQHLGEPQVAVATYNDTVIPHSLDTYADIIE
jgi:hypothetical protein